MKDEIKSFSDLKDLYSDKYIRLLERISSKFEISFEDIYAKLPSPELVKRDESFIHTCPVARVLLGVADPASYVLTYYYILDSIPDDYPERPMYYISSSEGSVPAPFTKTEFLESIRRDKRREK